MRCSNETARVHLPPWRRGGGVAARGRGAAAAGDAGDRPSQSWFTRGGGKFIGGIPQWTERNRLRRGPERSDRISLGRGTKRSIAGAGGGSCESPGGYHRYEWRWDA